MSTYQILRSIRRIWGLRYSKKVELKINVWEDISPSSDLLGMIWFFLSKTSFLVKILMISVINCLKDTAFQNFFVFSYSSYFSYHTSKEFWREIHSIHLIVFLKEREKLQQLIDSLFQLIFILILYITTSPFFESFSRNWT